MSPIPPRAVLFDAFGTVFDIQSPMRRHADRIGPHWQAISQEWRTRTMEYTWVRSLVGDAEHRPFSALSREALEVVAATHGLDPALVDDIAEASRTLDAYPDVALALERLRGAGVARAVLSNGEPDGMARQVEAAGLAPLFDALLSVEPAGTFKPDPRTYALATAHFGCAPSEIAFVSSNPWDAFGAAVFGFQVCWINRHARPVEYGLGGRAAILPDLAGLADVLLAARA